MQKSPKTQATGLLNSAETILIVGPHKPTLDTVCGVASMATVLKKSGKKVTAVAPDELPRTLKFLPETEVVGQAIGGADDFVISISTSNAAVKNVQATTHDGTVDLVLKTDGTLSEKDVKFRRHVDNFDAIVVIGAESLDDCGEIFAENAELFATTPILNVAVSPAAEPFGRVNLVDASASSVCELLTEIIESDENWQKHLDKPLATVLLSGVLAATESFLAPSTSATAFEVAARLQSLGADQSDVIEHLFKQKSFANLRVLGRMLNSLQLDRDHQMAWSTLTASDFELTDTDPDDIDHWADHLLRHLNETDVMAILVEREDGTLLQLRSGNEIDLAPLAEKFDALHESAGTGIDIHFGNKTVAEVQMDILRTIANWQEQRLRLPAGTEIKKVDLTAIAMDPDQPSLPKMPAQKKETPRAPQHVPFSVMPKDGETAEIEIKKQ